MYCTWFFDALPRRSTNAHVLPRKRRQATHSRLVGMLDSRFIFRAAFMSALVLGSTWVGYSLWRRPAHNPPEIRRLADGTVASLAADTRLRTEAGFPSPHELSLDGEGLLKVPASEQPLIVRTRLMHLEVRGPSTLAITAWSRETGEQVEVLSGEVIVSKNYASPYRVPDDLHGGEMSMVNQTIDLMEKENMESASLGRIRARANRLK